MQNIGFNYIQKQIQKTNLLYSKIIQNLLTIFKIKSYSNHFYSKNIFKTYSMIIQNQEEEPRFQKHEPENNISLSTPEQENQQSTDETKPLSPFASCCIECANGRVFPTMEGLEQHVLAKHGRDQHIQPDWFYRNLKYQPLGQDASFACTICAFAFDTQDALAKHISNLKPSTEVFTCSKCAKRFTQERAQRQHQNVCLFRRR